jgi:F-type H+-transporting ATPase subunit a
MAEGGEPTGFNIKPMDQFLIEPLFGGAEIAFYTPTNVTLWLAIAVTVIAALFVLGTRPREIVPGRVQSVTELAYGFIRSMVEDVVGREGLRFVPYVMTLFLFIFTANFLGLVPMSFTVTSQIAVTATLALIVFLSVTILGFVRKGPAFLAMFWVSSAPLALRPVLALIEIISYFVRPVSHSVRLAGNLTAGHAVIKVFAGFAAMAVVAPLAILGVIAIYAIEVIVATVQAYVFTILTCVYLRDAVSDDAHH